MAARKLRIAVWHNLPSGGAKRALYDHVRGLVGRGHHVEAWCPPQADRSYLPLADHITEHVVALDIDAPRPRRVLERLGLVSRAARIHSRVEQHCQKVAAEIGDGFDVVFAANCQLVGVPPLAPFTSVPTVIYLQEPNRPLYEAMPTLPWLDGGKRAREATVAAQAELVSICAFDRVLVNSRFSRESVLRAFGVDADVCYLGVDTELFRPGEHPTRDFFLCVGSLSRVKGVETVLRALAATAGAPPLVWVANIVQSESYVGEVRALARSLGVSLDLRRAINGDELHTLLQHARALVYAPTLEPFGYAPLEAAASGTAVIATAEGGVRETVVDGVHGRLIAPDVTALASAMTELWSDAHRADHLGASARADVERNWGIDDAVNRVEHHLLSAAFVRAS